MAIAPEQNREQMEQYLESKLDAQRSSTLIQVGCALAAVACFAAAAMMHNPINRQRKDLQLVLQSNVYKELPPEYAWVSAMGGTLRGIAADILWARAEKLKEEGKYFESHQIAKWICTLQPRFGQVWQFQAWNMAYNISVATHTPQERWQWVYNGVRLLRDEGIPNNDRNLLIYQQLAWIWFHKIGDRMDDFHMTYKREWATTMDVLLGSPPIGLSNEETINWFRPVADAPRTLDELLKAHPGVENLVKQLDDLGVDVNAETRTRYVKHPLEEKFFNPYTKYLQNKQLLAYRGSQLSENEAKLAEFFEAAPPTDLGALLAYLRAKVLREQYKMDPKLMLALTGRLGTPKPIPIDWRTPWSQTLYWATLGSDKGAELRQPKEFEVLQVDRNMLFALKTLAKQGRYLFRANVDQPKASFLNMMPDTRYIEAMHLKYVELGPKHKEENENVEGMTNDALRSGHVNELHDAIVNLYMAGKKDEARQYLVYLAKHYKEQYTNKIQDQYLQDVETFVRSQLKELVDSYASANSLIYSFLDQAYTRLAAGDADEYSNILAQASYVYEVYQSDKRDDKEGRRSLPTFVQMRANALAGFVTDIEWPLSTRAATWLRVTSAEVKQPVYDEILPSLKAQCEKLQFDINKAFPEPPGMEAWRAAHPNMQGVGQLGKPVEPSKPIEPQKK